eukprot:scaffold6785_cov76-Skeletonema_dohrnii-CCMP3373.AAC.3
MRCVHNMRYHSHRPKQTSNKRSSALATECIALKHRIAVCDTYLKSCGYLVSGLKRESRSHAP